MDVDEGDPSRGGQIEQDLVVAPDPGRLERRVAVRRALRRDRVVGRGDGTIRFAASRSSSSSRISAAFCSYVASGTPWTTSLTPTRSVANSGRSAASCGSSTSITSSDVKPFTPRFATSSSAGPSPLEPGDELVRPALLGASASPVPIVYESQS